MINKVLKLTRDLAQDENGASFLEYTVLIGITLAVSLATVVAVGDWANARWTQLNTTVNP